MATERSLSTVSMLKVLGYSSSCCLRRCDCDELPCPLLCWLSAELQAVCPQLPERSGDMLLVRELRTLLENLFSPFSLLPEVLEPDFLNKITEFLASELQAARIIKYKELHPDDKAPGDDSEKEQRVEDGKREENGEFCQENDEDDISCKNRRDAEAQAEWVLLLHALGRDASSTFTDVLCEVESRLDKCGDTMEPLLHTSLSSEQWKLLEKINQVLSEDYQCRRQMIIKRFQVTLQSFAWGDKQKERDEALASVPPLASLAGFSQVSVPLVLAARADQSSVQPITAGASTSVYKVLMGGVPDRGGRPGEIEPPMPTWEERRASGNRSGRGSGQQKWHKFKGKKKKGKQD